MSSYNVVNEAFGSFQTPQQCYEAINTIQHEIKSIFNTISSIKLPSNDGISEQDFIDSCKTLYPPYIDQYSRDRLERLVRNVYDKSLKTYNVYNWNILEDSIKSLYYYQVRLLNVLVVKLEDKILDLKMTGKTKKRKGKKSKQQKTKKIDISQYCSFSTSKPDNVTPNSLTLAEDLVLVKAVVLKYMTIQNVLVRPEDVDSLHDCDSLFCDKIERVDQNIDIYHGRLYNCSCSNCKTSIYEQNLEEEAQDRRNEYIERQELKNKVSKQLECCGYSLYEIQSNLENIPLNTYKQEFQNQNGFFVRQITSEYIFRKEVKEIIIDNEHNKKLTKMYCVMMLINPELCSGELKKYLRAGQHNASIIASYL